MPPVRPLSQDFSGAGAQENGEKEGNNEGFSPLYLFPISPTGFSLAFTICADTHFQMWAMFRSACRRVDENKQVKLTNSLGVTQCLLWSLSY